jgi:hypothetical protein
MCWRILTKLRQVKIFLSRDWLTLTVVPPPLVDCIANENKFSVQLQMTGHRTEPWKQPIETKNRGSSVGSSPHRAGSRLADAALRICFGDPLARSEQEEPHSRYCRRVDPLARLPLGTRKVLSFIDRAQTQRWSDDSEHAASSVLLYASPSNRGLIHRLLSGDGSGGGISSSNVFLRISGTSCIGEETRG